VAQHLAAVPGRKNVILISGKIFLPDDFKEQVRVLRTIIQAGVSIYAIDPGGLAPYALDATFVIPSLVTMNARDPNRAAREYIGQAADWKRRISLMLQASLRSLAEDTGGRVFVNTNDILGAIRSSLDDSRVTYILGFYPKTSNIDGSFHPIKVRLPGREHLSVRYRTGYFEPEPPLRDPQRREAELRDALWQPVDAAAIELSGTVTPDCQLQLNIGLAAVNLQQDGDRWSGQIEVSLFERDDSGNSYEPLTQTLGLRLTQATFDKMLQHGLPYTHAFRLDPRATSLRVIVRDLNSASIGTLTIPVPATAP